MDAERAPHWETSLRRWAESPWDGIPKPTGRQSGRVKAAVISAAVQDIRPAPSFIRDLQRPVSNPQTALNPPEGFRDPRRLGQSVQGSPAWPQQVPQEYSWVNLVWKWLSFSNSSRSFSMGGRMVILKWGSGKPRGMGVGRDCVDQASPEVIGALPLPEATPRHHADAGLL
jgi:hypothetical protein